MTQVLRAPCRLSSQRWRGLDSDIITLCLSAAADSSPSEPDSPVATETISVKLLTSVRPRGPATSLTSTIGLNSQEQVVSDHWFSALDLSAEPTACGHIAGTTHPLLQWLPTGRGSGTTFFFPSDEVPNLLHSTQIYATKVKVLVHVLSLLVIIQI